MPVVDTTDPYAWETAVEANLFTRIRKMEELGISEEKIDEYFTKKVADLEIEGESIRQAAGLDLPWWIVLWRFIKNWFRGVQLFIFPPRHEPATRYIDNPVGSIPVLGQLVGFGMEIGKQLRGDENVVIRNQYGHIPILSETFQVGGFLVDHWQMVLIGGTLLVGLWAAGKVVGIVRVFTPKGG